MRHSRRNRLAPSTPSGLEYRLFKYQTVRERSLDCPNLGAYHHIDGRLVLECSGMNDQDVHVVFGEVSAGALKQALGRGHSVVTQRDFLSSGPVPHLENWQDWLQVRRQHWHRLIGKEGPFLYNDQVDLYLQIDELRLSSRILLWCGTGLEDQLLKVFLPRFMERFSIDLGKLHVFQLDAIAAGYLGPEGFLDHPAPPALTKEEISKRSRPDAYH